MSNEPAVVLYDGECGFCNASVQFIIKRDPKVRFQFAPLQSTIGKSLAADHGVDPEPLDGLVLVEEGKAYQKSAAALRIARRLTWPWPIFAVLTLVPRIVRDWFYDQFAKRRYAWFGKVDSCRFSTMQDESDRFLSTTKPADRSAGSR
jgi:predicted DCC family thiol-disulfide oxidoreductase YuxK